MQLLPRYDHMARGEGRGTRGWAGQTPAVHTHAQITHTHTILWQIMAQCRDKISLEHGLQGDYNQVSLHTLPTHT